MKDVFKEKYLEYDPSITLEIFTLVWNKLIKLGYKSFNNVTIEERYDEFKGFFDYFRTSSDYPKEFNCYSNGTTYTKTTVEEILGYNPFIKDDFVLPKKWCIKIQANGIPYEVAQWRKSTWSDSGYMSSSGTWHCDNAIGYPEITLDQFKKYVLKEPTEQQKVMEKDWSKATDEELLEEAKRRYPIGCEVKLIKHNIGGDFNNEVRFTRHKFYTSGERKQLFIDGNLLIFDNATWAEIESLPEVEVKDETKEVIPKYVECLENSSGFTIRKIYQTNNISTKDWYKFDKDDLGRNNGWDKKFFKPSTKEAYDKQVSNKEPIRLSFYVKYCDGFTEDLLKSLLEWSQKNTTLKNRGRDNSFKGLKEDRYFLFDNFGFNSSKSCLYKDRSTYGYGVDNNTQGCFKEYSIKEVKELIGYKEQKPIEKWSFGSYIVFLQNEVLTRTGNVTKGKLYQIADYGSVRCPYFYDDIDRLINFTSKDSDKYGLKWFATKSEAEEFAKTLVESIKEEVKQQLKQAVHCTTKEEWDFVKNKINRDNEWEEDYPCQILVGKTNWKGGIQFCIDEGIQILSFQEWCDLNGYKMKKEVKFEVGKWYSMKTAYSWIIKYKGTIDGRIEADWYCENEPGKKVEKGGNWLTEPTNIKELSLEEIQQYLPDGHPDKISSVKDTVILNESSIGKFISFKYNVCNKFYNKALIIKENGNIYLLNNCHPNNNGHKDKSIYKYSLKYNNLKEVEYFCKEIKFLTAEEVPKPKMILSIDDEELPMVNISKTNSLKQLLNLE